MGLMVAVLLVVGVVLIVRSLRLWGCGSFALWLLIGLVGTWLILLVASGRVQM